jgi:hypothetical protein
MSRINLTGIEYISADEMLRSACRLALRVKMSQ